MEMPPPAKWSLVPKVIVGATVLIGTILITTAVNRAYPLYRGPDLGRQQALSGMPSDTLTWTCAWKSPVCGFEK
jgi:hypothetical protein